MIDSTVLLGRKESVTISGIHAVNQDDMKRPLHDYEENIVIGMGCFWGAERKFWNMNGVVVTSVGYAGGSTENPTYEEVCSGRTWHTEVVSITFDTRTTNLETVLKVFWENHDPTQGMRQGNDLGTQYRSAIYTTKVEQEATVETSREAFQAKLTESGFGTITTECTPLSTYYFAEENHQQYLYKNPAGYCGLSGTGVTCPIGLV